MDVATTEVKSCWASWLPPLTFPVKLRRVIWKMDPCSSRPCSYRHLQRLSDPDGESLVSAFNGASSSNQPTYDHLIRLCPGKPVVLSPLMTDPIP